MNTDQPRKRPPTSATRHGNGSGLWGPANGMGWGGPARGSSGASGRPPTPEERRLLRVEMMGLYVTIARDPEQPAMLRLHAASRLLERLDNPFEQWGD